MKKILILAFWLVALVLFAYFMVWFAGYDSLTGTSTTNSLPEIIENLFHKK